MAAQDRSFLLLFSHQVLFSSLLSRGQYPARLLCPWDFAGKNTGVDYHFLFQGVCPPHGSNPHLLHRRQILYHCATRTFLNLYCIHVLLGHHLLCISCGPGIVLGPSPSLPTGEQELQVVQSEGE